MSKALRKPVQKLKASADSALPSLSTLQPEPLTPQASSQLVERGSVCFWGTRGSTPTPGAAFVRHGGNTSCLCIKFGDRTFIFDAGSGIRELGMVLTQQPQRNLDLFVTHTHWDHIQGFPFFGPAYTPGFDIQIHGGEKTGKTLESIFQAQLNQEYFPVQLEDLNSRLHFRPLEQNPIVLGNVKVSWEFAVHPSPTVGYKIDLDGFQVAWVPDNEFIQGYTGAPEDLDPNEPRLEPHRKMINFLKGVDVLIHEAQYTDAEYVGKVAWGHSSISNACLLVKLAGIRRWIITHHDPLHSDEFLDAKLEATRAVLARLGHVCEVTHGFDGCIEKF